MTLESLASARRRLGLKTTIGESSCCYSGKASLEGLKEAAAAGNMVMMTNERPGRPTEFALYHMGSGEALCWGVWYKRGDFLLRV